LRTSDFDFDLPGELIAQRPAEPRDSARLLDLRGEVSDRAIADLPDILEPGSLLVVNDTRVIPAQLEGHRGEARIGVTLHKDEGDGEWLAFAKNARRLKLGHVIEFGGDFAAEVVARYGAEVRLRFNRSAETFRKALEEYGRPPLPPYIKRAESHDHDDVADYQTMFAAHEGAVAAPTAGLHFTPELVGRLEGAGFSLVSLTLHVGAGTFLPVTADAVSDHKMHYEYGEISAAVATLAAFRDDTNLFITPGYSFRIVDQLLTNFHLPRSTLFMLVCAFAGMDHMQRAYAHAIERRYRFFSYGDATLLEREIR